MKRTRAHLSDRAHVEGEGPKPSFSPRPHYRRAVSLEYVEVGEEAPRVNAQGDNLVADEIVKIARRFGVPVVEKPEMARALSSIPLDQEIPEALFEAVALMLQELKKAVT